MQVEDSIMSVTNWVNVQLEQIGSYVEDLYQDLRDGRNLILLLEFLSGERIIRQSSRLRVHMLQNIRAVLDFLERHQIRTATRIRAKHIVDGDPTATLDLITSIFVRYKHQQRSFQQVNVVASSSESTSNGQAQTSMRTNSLRHRNPRGITESRSLYKDDLNDTETTWKIGTWSEPVIDVTVGDAKRMILDAFVIYLSRISAQTEVEFGWYIAKTLVKQSNIKRCHFVVPMRVIVLPCYEWSHVSEAIDEELAIIARSFKIASNQIWENDCLVEMACPWKIVVSSIDCEADAIDPEFRGGVLTLQIDKTGRYRWIHDASRLTPDLCHLMNRDLRQIVEPMLTTNDTHILLYDLDVFPENNVVYFFNETSMRSETTSEEVFGYSSVRPEFEATFNEMMLVTLWKELFDLNRVHRWDSFFALGGDSILAAQLIERTRELGYRLSLHNIFMNPSLCDMARTVDHGKSIDVPPNLISKETTMLTPEMLPLIDLTQTDINHIISQVPGGISNVQDIYALSPLQHDILSLHLEETGGRDHSVIGELMFVNRFIMERYISAIQQVVDRHDILRTVFSWEKLSMPAQIVLRSVTLSVIEVELSIERSAPSEPLSNCCDPSLFSINPRRSPMLYLIVARETNGSWVLFQILHCLIGDHTVLKGMFPETLAFLNERGDTLPIPIPFRNHIVEMMHIDTRVEHERFFTEMLADIEQPTLCFGPINLHESHTACSHRTLSRSLVNRLRIQARNLNVTLATLCHLAWAIFVSRTSGFERVVFGSVLSNLTNSAQWLTGAMGPFINILPLKFDVNETLIPQSVYQMHLKLALLLDVKHTTLTLSQRCSRIEGNPLLFNSVFHFRHDLDTVSSGDIATGISFVSFSEGATYPLELSVNNNSATLTLDCHTASSVDSNRVCTYTEQALESLVECLECSREKSIRCIEVLPLSERDLTSKTFDYNEVPLPDLICMHQYFERQVTRSPSAIALVHNDTISTYAEVNVRANRLAFRLIELGVGPDSLVGICISVSINMIVAILATLKAGGAYVPLDPLYPVQRQLEVIRDSSLNIVISDEIESDLLKSAMPTEVIVINSESSASKRNENPVVRELVSQNLAYVIYTSGSTGKPKSVLVEHRSLVRLFDVTASYFQFDQRDVWCLAHSIGFDFSVWEIWGALRFGGQLVLMSRDVVRSPELTNDFIRRHRISVLNQTPSAFKAILFRLIKHSIPKHLRFVIFGGETFDSTILRPFYHTNKNTSTRFVNMYGPTESTVWTTFKEFNEQDTLKSSHCIGDRLSDMRTYLLDTYQRPVPFGAIGELYIGGAGVARGYLNRPELSSKHFILDSFSDSFDARMYRSGDLARYEQDGTLSFAGRNDRQVKVRGYRIEPGDIESCLRRHQTVRDVIVIAIGEEPDKSLVAYVVTEPCHDISQTLREHVRKQLPEFMVPSAIVRIAEIPLTINGKIDLKALPVVDETAVARQEYEAPQNDVENMLARIWGESLNLTEVSRNDSFFALGGHSFLVIRVIERVRDFGYQLSIGDFYLNPVLSELAATVQEANSIADFNYVIDPKTTLLTPEMLPLIDLTQGDIDRIITKVPGGIQNIQDIYTLSPFQDGILFHRLLTTKADPYLIMDEIAFTNRIALDRYISAVQRVVDRHDIMRTAFFWEKLSTPAQVVFRNAIVSITEFELSLTERSAREQLVQRFNPRSYRMNLNQAPLLHTAVAREADGTWILIQLCHHLVCDNILFQTISAEVSAILNGRANTYRDPVSFRHFIANVRTGIDTETNRKFFTDMLYDIDQPTLSFGIFDIFREDTHTLESNRPISSELHGLLRRQARKMEVSAATLCHVAWALVVSRTSGLEKLVFGTVLFVRSVLGKGSDKALGLFLNTLPLRFDIDDTPVDNFVHGTHAALAQLLIHQHASLAVAQRCGNLSPATPLFNSLLNYRHNVSFDQEVDIDIGGKLVGCLQLIDYPLVMSVDDDASRLGLLCHVTEPIDPDLVCAYMHQALEYLGKTLNLAHPIPIRQIDVLPESERISLLDTRNNGTVMSPDLLCVHQYFEQHVAMTPTKLALQIQDEIMTYEEVNIRANRLAHQLIQFGVVPDMSVGICVSVSLELIIGILAILKAGGAYVPLDLAQPQQRLIEIITDGSLKFVVSDKIGVDKLNFKTPVVWTFVHPNAPLTFSVTNPNVYGLSPRNLAYVMFTSGSTGKPKGVMVEHSHVVRLLDATELHMPVTGSDIWCLFHSVSFDFSVHEIWGPLNYGGKLILLSREEFYSPDYIHELICGIGITVLTLTYGTFKTIISYFLKHLILDRLNYIMLGGEPIDPSAMQSLFTVYGDTLPPILNMYGPTETTVTATVKRVCKQDTFYSTSPIGRRQVHTRIYLLDSDQRPVPFGAVGEIYIGGFSVARGYFNMPQLTSVSFLDDPFTQTADARMYKTADLARYLPDGSLIFLGRIDRQLKIRGFRMEAAEIEARLRRHCAVHDALVLTYGSALDKRLVAYVVAEPSNDLAAILRLHMMNELPEYMVPAAIVRLDALPLNRNGKVDMRALPVPDDSSLSRQTYEPPQGEIEIMLATIWQDLLDVETVSRNDSFFGVGGHSLIAIQVIERVRSLGYELTIRNLFERPTLSEMSKMTKAHRSVVIPVNTIVTGVGAITPKMLPLIDLTQTDIDHIITNISGGISNIQDIYALSPMQDGILFHHLLTTEGDPYLLLFRYEFTDRLLLDRFISAFEKIMLRHDTLRTAFFWETLSSPAQVVLREVTLPVTEIETLPNEGSACDQLIRRYDQRLYRMNLQKAPLIHFAIARELDGRWVLVHLQHHLIGDHTMMNVIHTEMTAILHGQEDTLPEPLPYRNLIANVRVGVSHEAYVHYFTEMLADVSHPTLAFGLIEVYRDGSSIAESHRTLPQNLHEEVRNQARNAGVTSAAFCHLAWALVVSRASGHRSLVFGTVLFGRLGFSKGTGGAIGLFINTLPLKFVIDDKSVRSSIYQTHENLARLLEYEHASLAVAQRCSGLTNGTPLFNSLLNYRHNLVTGKQNVTETGIKEIGAFERTNYPVTFSVDDGGSNLDLSALIAAPVDPDRVCVYMVKALESLTDSLNHNPDIPVHCIEVLPEHEREFLLKKRNVDDSMRPDIVCLHQLFEHQAALAPTATALVYEDQICIYAELNIRANRLAHRLIELGVGPDRLVGICMSVSLAMLVGILAILKAGGTYVPLDSSLPVRRLIEIITDSSLNIIIADIFEPSEVKIDILTHCIIIDPNVSLPHPDTNPIVRDLHSRNGAYVIYTSGSTGRPKGVMVDHCNIVRLFDAVEFRDHFTQRDVWCSLHSIGFDFSIWEMWGALSYGGKLVLSVLDIVPSPDVLYQLIDRHRINVLNLTPSLFKASFERLTMNSILSNLRYIILGGEPLDPSILKPLYTSQKEYLPRFINMYGTTETTVITCYKVLTEQDALQSASIIGEPLSIARTYLLDRNKQPVPVGVVGEMYIGGVLVARGYLNKPELTSHYFLADPFVDSMDAKMYKTGDLAHYRPDGSLVFVGRNDQQIKVRGYRIEAGEVASKIRRHPAVKDAHVLPYGNQSDTRLVAYIVAEAIDGLARELRSQLSDELPEYMIPSAFVHLEQFPLTLNGKLNVGALPSIDDTSLVRENYEAPKGHVEVCLAIAWQTLLNLELVSRHDSFFALGGQSLLAMRMVEIMRSQGMTVSIRDVFRFPILCRLAETVQNHVPFVIPPNVLTPATVRITPEMLPLIDLTQSDIDHIVSMVPGGVSNIKDVYQLSPMQDGILFHHLLATSGDPYLSMRQMSFSNYGSLDRYLAAYQKVMNRHDIFRTAFFWEGISVPAQVVLRQSSPCITEWVPESDAESVSEQLANYFNPRHYRIDIREAPLVRFIIAREFDTQWILTNLLHHLITDEKSGSAIDTEILALFNGHDDSILSTPIPFRNHISEVCRNFNEDSHIDFFTRMLADIDEPTLPFGLDDVYGRNSQVGDSSLHMASDCSKKLRLCSQILETSLATLCHLAWALVVSRASTQTKAVFGTVLFGRLQAGNSTNTGAFINTLPVRVDIDSTPVNKCAQQMKMQLAELMVHEHAPLVLAQRCSSIAIGIPLFSSLLNYRNFTVSPLAMETAADFKIIRTESRPNYPLIMSVNDDAPRLSFEVQALESIDPAKVCAYMQEALNNLTVALEEIPQSPVCSVDILPEAERRLLLETWNCTSNVNPEPACIHQLFERQVILAPSSAALIYEDQTITYADLDTRANLLANRLIALGVRTESLIGICVPVSLGLLIGLLAIMKAGGAYVPLDPAYPVQRLIGIITDASLNIIVADEFGSEKLGKEILTPRIVVNPNTVLPQPDIKPIIHNLSSRNLAYIIYTSGSTGHPKSIMIEHRNVTRLFDAIGAPNYFNQHDVWCLSHSVSFDFSVWEIWGALRYGGQLVLMSRDVIISPDGMYELLCKRRVTVLNHTPTLFREILHTFIKRSIPSDLRFIILGGESFDPCILHPLYRAYGDALPRFMSLYGPTEITMWATAKELYEQDMLHSASPIGDRISDTQVYVLDAHRRPVPLGAIGELYISGPGVARGYLNRPDLTSKCFLANPISDAMDSRMYKTGDLARYRPDGSLIFVGRNDEQIKIRGYRVEAGEIEECLATYPAVQKAVVLLHDDGDTKILVCYVVATPEKYLSRNLHRHLKSKLPEFMIPTKFIRIDALPFTINGKLDKNALPAPETDTSTCEVYEAPQNDTECMLAGIWTQLLGIKKISRYDSFFTLGGNSLLALRFIGRLRSFGYQLDISNLFTNLTLSELAKSVRNDRSIVVPPNTILPGSTVITPDMLPLIDLNQTDIDRIVAKVSGGIENIQDIYALSPVQDGILFHHLLATEGDPYLTYFQFVFSERSHLDQYLSAIQEILNRHDILRTAIFWRELSTAAQVVFCEVALSVVELDLSAENGPIIEQLTTVYHSSSYRMDLEKAPLIRFVVARNTDGSWILVGIFSHLIFDYTMSELMRAEIEMIINEQRESLPNPVPYRNYIASVLFGVSEEVHRQFFTNMLADVDQSTIAFGLTGVHENGLQVTELECSMQQSLISDLRRLTRNAGVSLASLVHVAWGMIVSRTCGLEKSVFGTVLIGRMTSGQGSESAMGLFINTLPIRIDIDHKILDQCLRDTHNQLAQLMRHEHASLAIVQRCSGISNGTPLFNSILNHRHHLDGAKENRISKNMKFVGSWQRTNYPLGTSVDDYGSDLIVSCQVLKPINPARLCGYVEQALLSLVECWQSEQSVSVHSIEIMPKTEHQLLLRTWNLDQTSRPDFLCIHQYFEIWASHTPTATALLHRNEILTYAELNDRSNRLAHWLIKMNVGPEHLVGLCVSISPAMIVAIIAILKAGGAYVAMDPVYPKQRLIDIINDATIEIIIADDTGSKTLGNELLNGRIVIDPNAPISGPNFNPIIRDLGVRNLVYVLYTSGTTGKPKSVMVEHRNIVRLFDGTWSWSRSDEHDVWCLFHSVSFDFSVWEMWGALRYGGRLVLMSRDVVRSPDETYELICEHRITVFNQTPTAFREIVDKFITKPIPRHLRWIMFGAEAFNPSILQPLYDKKDELLPRFVNAYGPTETSVYTTYKVMSKQDSEHSSSPIGKRISDTKVYLLDSHSRPIPLGAIGEIYIGGPGVTRGYFKRPDLTSERFFADHFNDAMDSRMYKTGDLGRYLPDGTIVYMGRTDEQVKIRGYRVELREIETCLCTYPGLKQAVVIPFDYGDQKMLVAYVDADANEDLASNLRRHLTSHLPDHMIPFKFIPVDALPLTPSGKLDKKALPHPDSGECPREVHVTPQTNIEWVLASVWGQLLGIEQVGRNENFFALGGHSLLAFRMVKRLAERGLSCLLNDIFEYPVLVDLALRIAQHTSFQLNSTAIPIRSTGSEVPVFFTPTGHGDFSYVFTLCEHIRPSCPIFALPWPPLPDPQVATMVDLARKMIPLIKSVQPHGLYRICGYSGGGYLCYAIADALLDAGDSVSFVGLIDTLAFDDRKKRFPWQRRAAMALLLEYNGHERKDDMVQLLQKVDKMSLRQFVEQAQRMKFLPNDLPVDFHVRELLQNINFGELAEGYVPRELGITIHQFNAIEACESYASVDQEIGSAIDEQSPDWSKRLPNTLFEITLVPGDHTTLMKNPENRLLLCQALNHTIPS